MNSMKKDLVLTPQQQAEAADTKECSFKFANVLRSTDLLVSIYDAEGVLLHPGDQFELKVTDDYVLVILVKPTSKQYRFVSIAFN